MALDSYANLQTEIGDYLGRTDLNDKIPTFITLAEAQIRRRLRRRSLRTSILISSDATALPSDVAELRSLRLSTSSAGQDLPINVGSFEMLSEVRAMHGGVTGRPVQAAILGGTLYVAPAPASSYDAEITYYEKLVSLSDDNPSNSVLVEAPDLYLWGALKEAAPYLQHDERIPVWTEKFNEALAELDTAREREETQASLRPVRLPRSF